MKDALDKLLKYSGLIIAMAVGIAIARLFWPSQETVEVLKPYPVRDSAAIKRAIANVERIREDTVATLWDKIFRLQKRTPATGYYGTPGADPYPPRELRISAKDSSIIAGVAVPAIDAPISVEADRHTVTVTTRNEWLRARGEDYVKVYQWPRIARDFSFALTETQNSNRLDGINLYFNKRAFEFDGFGIIIGAEYPGLPAYAGVDARFILWEKVELSPRLLSIPQAGFELRWKF